MDRTAQTVGIYQLPFPRGKPRFRQLRKPCDFILAEKSAAVKMKIDKFPPVGYNVSKN